jgi:hypothetical protein
VSFERDLEVEQQRQRAEEAERDRLEAQRIEAERRARQEQIEQEESMRKTQNMCESKSGVTEKEAILISHFYRVSISTIKFLYAKANYAGRCTVVVDTSNGVKLVYFYGDGEISADQSSD